MGRRIGFFLLLTVWVHVPLAAAESNAVRDYAFAQKCYHTLDKNSARGYAQCIARFEGVLEKYPETGQAQKAMFSAARLSQEKYELEQKEEDLTRALHFYNRFLKEYPNDSMADDCLMRIAILRFEKQGDRTRAMRALGALLERYPRGDMAEAAVDYLGRIGEVKPSEKPSQSPAEQPVKEAVPERRIPDPAQNKDGAAASPRRFTIVIDPGHGGKDTGALGPLGTKEAVVSLQIARKLAFLLEKKLNAKVYLTRTNHRGLTLEERADEAKGADLFVSIHANAHASRDVHGIQTFYLNNAASSAARQLAERENRVAGRALPVADRILSTMLQNANTEESRDLARVVQTSLVGRLKKNYGHIKDLNVETALFDVLLWAKCPSILVETSFISNPREEKRLRDSEYQWAVADGITAGVDRYIHSRAALASSL